MPVEIKFCGLTRREDAGHAVALGASFVGVIFAGGPRNLTADQAADVFADVPGSVRRVGVFADQEDDELTRIADRADLDVIQLHARWDPERVVRLRQQLERDVWPVVRVEDAILPEWSLDAIRIGDGTVFDALVPGALGGTGVRLAWTRLAPSLSHIRGEHRVILAGGLRPENVAEAIAELRPNVVDVSSGVESAPGIKDHDRMRAFRDAVVHAASTT